MIRLEFNLHSSFLLAGLLLVLHLGALLALEFSNFPLWVKFSALFCLLVSFCYYIRRYVFYKSQNAIVRFWVVEEEREAQWYVQTANQLVSPAKLRGDSLVTGFLLILNFSLEKTRRPKTVILFRDSLESNAFRQLMIYLFR